MGRWDLFSCYISRTTFVPQVWKCSFIIFSFLFVFFLNTLYFLSYFLYFSTLLDMHMKTDVNGMNRRATVLQREKLRGISTVWGVSTYSLPLLFLLLSSFLVFFPVLFCPPGILLWFFLTFDQVCIWERVPLANLQLTSCHRWWEYHLNDLHLLLLLRLLLFCSLSPMILHISSPSSFALLLYTIFFTGNRRDGVLARSGGHQSCAFLANVSRKLRRKWIN